MTKLRLYKLAVAELLRLWAREEELSKNGNLIAKKRAESLKKEIEELSPIISREERKPVEFLLMAEEEVNPN